MAQHKAVAIVPAHNEAGRLGRVLRVLCSARSFAEIIVVDDGSTDETAEVAGDFPVRVIRMARNCGKGSAMETGVRASGASTIFFCDADVRGLTPKMIRAIIAPVAAGKTDMMIAMRDRILPLPRILFRFLPHLGGERALRRELWECIPPRYKHRFMIETALNHYARHTGGGYRYDVFRGLYHTVKERKHGLLHGLLLRVCMVADIIRAHIMLRTDRIPGRIPRPALHVPETMLRSS